jgi:hypothetical protein
MRLGFTDPGCPRSLDLTHRVPLSMTDTFPNRSVRRHRRILPLVSEERTDPWYETLAVYVVVFGLIAILIGVAYKLLPADPGASGEIVVQELCKAHRQEICAHLSRTWIDRPVVPYLLSNSQPTV